MVAKAASVASGLEIAQMTFREVDLGRECAFAVPCLTSVARVCIPSRWLRHYNQRRPRGGLEGLRPLVDCVPGGKRCRETPHLVKSHEPALGNIAQSLEPREVHPGSYPVA